MFKMYYYFKMYTWKTCECLYECVYVIVHRCTRACRLSVLKSGVCVCVRVCACVRVCVNNFGSVCGGGGGALQ